MIQINKLPGQKILEIGCGSTRNPNADVCVDIRSTPATDFTVDLSSPNWPISSEEFDAVLASFVLEHIPYPRLSTTLKEIYRVLKPGGTFIGLVPDTWEQLKWIQNNIFGWDGKDFFESASCLLFGDQRHSEREGESNFQADTHKCFFSVDLIRNLFGEAGFEPVGVQPYGERKTDLSIIAKKPDTAQPVQHYYLKKAEVYTDPSIKAAEKVAEPLTEKTEVVKKMESDPLTEAIKEAEKIHVPAQVSESDKGSTLFGKKYFDMNGAYGPTGYMDFAVHDITFRHLLRYRPESVLELGVSRGYILKRFQDRGIRACGLDFSKHCWLTRVCDGIILHDLTKTPWPWKDQEFDLVWSIDSLDRLPEASIPAVVSEMKRVGKRVLHGLDFNTMDGGWGNTRITLKPRTWWQDQLLNQKINGDVIDKGELERGDFPKEVAEGDGKVKINLGCASTMMRYGWQNIDTLDFSKFAEMNGYKFQKHDITKGLPFATGTVDLAFAHHVLEHFSYADGLRLLREFRRVIKPDGAVRIVVPNAEELTMAYHNVSNGESCLATYDECNDGCKNASTAAGKLYAMLCEGHASLYDVDTLVHYLREAGFTPFPASFRQTGQKVVQQILRECIEMTYGPSERGLSLFVDSIPLVG